MQPKPHQIEGAKFLASRQTALLADEMRVGKTGTAIIAADLVMAHKILVVTTASGRGVWAKGFADWSNFGRSVGVLTDRFLKTDVVVAGWPSLTRPEIRVFLKTPDWSAWDLIILDEAHAAKNFEAKRTQAIFGQLERDGETLNQLTAITQNVRRVWCLTGTPLPHSPADAYPMLRALLPEALKAGEYGPDVMKYDDFLHRYCIVRMKKISQFNRIPVIIGGRNLPELKARMQPFMLRRTQADIGMQPPVYEILPLIVSEKERRAADGNADKAAILAAADAGSTKDLDMHLGPLRRLTGEIKAKAVAAFVQDEFENGLDKIVLMYWHRDVGDILHEAFPKAARLDGSTTDRDAQAKRFKEDPQCRVFLGQIVAAGEAIDLSTASELIFVETSFTPKDMAQAAARVTNQNNQLSSRIRVATLAGSIDEALQASLLRLWTAIREVLK